MKIPTGLMRENSFSKFIKFNISSLINFLLKYFFLTGEINQSSIFLNTVPSTDPSYHTIQHLLK